eukprot:5943955-Pyramimonas_sp.AAC.3
MSVSSPRSRCATALAEAIHGRQSTLIEARIVRSTPHRWDCHGARATWMARGGVAGDDVAR